MFLGKIKGEFSLLVVFNIFIGSSLGCLTNPFRSPVVKSSDPNNFDGGKLLHGVAQGFRVNNVNENPHEVNSNSQVVYGQIIVGGKDNKAQLNQRLGSGLSVDVNNWRNGTNRLLTVKNNGQENEFVRISAYNSVGQLIPIDPSEFNLHGGSATEIPLTLRSKRRSLQEQSHESSEAPEPLQELITVQARGKRDSVQRSFFFGGDQDQQLSPQYNELEPFCFDKDVSGTCRYRSDPEDCFRWEWTAYATILNRGGTQKITSIPEGLFLLPGEHGRVRVYLKISCCTPVVQFVSSDHYQQANSCVVDVRELQILHPGEIAGIVVAALVLIIIIIVVIFLCLRKRRRENISVGMLPHRARSREIITRQ